HMHSHYIISSAGLPGYSHRETMLIALLTLYHRKAHPLREQLSILDQVDDLLRVCRLASLLRLAEYLDRSRVQAIARLRLRPAGAGKLRLLAHIRPGADGRVEIWEGQRNADLFEEAFGCKLEIKAN